MTHQIQCQCGAYNDKEKSFCDNCGTALGNLWARETNEFASVVPPEKYQPKEEGAVVIRFGSRGLIFENGVLVQVVESGKYSLQKETLLGKLFGKKKAFSVFVVDAGDVSLAFDMAQIYTMDQMPVDLKVEVVFRCEESSTFFMNVMKSQTTFEVRDFRPLLFGEIKNALEEVLSHYTLSDLNTSLEFKNQMASRMEAHLRTTLERMGLVFMQVKTLTVTQAGLDQLKKRDAERQIKRQTLRSDREDIDMKVDEMDVKIHESSMVGEKQIQQEMVSAEFLNKRVAVLKTLQEAETANIKTKEEFRKFQREIDRDRVLDDAEWKEFEKEILYKEEDQARDRKFLTEKIRLQQAHDIRRIALLNDRDLTLEQKKSAFEALDYELSRELDLEFRRIEGVAKVEMARVQADAAQKKVSELSAKETEITTKLKDLAFQKSRAQDEIEMELDKGKARHELSRLEIEENRMKAELGLQIREKREALDIKHKKEQYALDAQKEVDQLEVRLKESESRHSQEIERMRALGDLNIEQLISVSGQNQAAMLKDLAQSQTLKGLSPDEIMAMKNPEAFKDALVERAKHVDSDQLKSLYERIINITEQSSQREVLAHKDTADRLERMAKNLQHQSEEAFRALSGQNRTIADTREQAADRTTSISERAMDRMADVAGAGSFSDPNAGSRAPRIMVCKNCKQEIEATSNHCGNCGEKLF